MSTDMSLIKSHDTGFCGDFIKSPERKNLNRSRAASSTAFAASAVLHQTPAMSYENLASSVLIHSRVLTEHQITRSTIDSSKLEELIALFNKGTSLRNNAIEAGQVVFDDERINDLTNFDLDLTFSDRLKMQPYRNPTFSIHSFSLVREFIAATKEKGIDLDSIPTYFDQVLAEISKRDDFKSFERTKEALTRFMKDYIDLTKAIEQNDKRQIAVLFMPMARNEALLDAMRSRSVVIGEDGQSVVCEKLPYQTVDVTNDLLQNVLTLSQEEFESKHPEHASVWKLIDKIIKIINRASYDKSSFISNRLKDALVLSQDEFVKNRGDRSFWKMIHDMLDDIAK